MIARKGTRSVYNIISSEREWILVLIAINSAGSTMPSYYIFKEKRPRQEYISLREDGACIDMQENGYMDSSNFSIWITSFIRLHETKGNLEPTRRMLLILDGHKSHVTLEVLLKAKDHGLDMVSLPSHSSHEL